MHGLDGTVAVVTGAGSGIGRASAERFADEGAAVVVADVAAEAGRETVERIDDEGGEATFVEVDVAEVESVERMVDVAVETYGGLDFAHNNAGILTSFADVTDVDEPEWDRLLDVNLKGIWTCLRAELPVLEAQGGGAIVNTASESGLVGMAGLSSYAASKHGVVGLTKSVALEYASRDVRVNAIAPGPTETTIAANLTVAEDVDDLPFDLTAMAETPMGRMATPAEVAGVVAFLCSDDASYVTGHTIPVDGGQAVD